MARTSERVFVVIDALGELLYVTTDEEAADDEAGDLNGVWEDEGEVGVYRVVEAEVTYIY